MTFEDIVFVLREQSMLLDTVPPPAPLPAATPLFFSTPTTERKAGRPTHASQLAARKKPPTDIAKATLAGSSSRQPHIDPHAAPPTVIPVDYEIILDKSRVQAYLDKWEAKEYLQLRPDHLQWSPFLVTRGYGLDVPVGSIAKAPRGEIEVSNGGMEEGEIVHANAAASLAARVGNGLGTNRIVEQEIVASATDTNGSPTQRETNGPPALLFPAPSALSPLSQLLAASEAESTSRSYLAAPAPLPPSTTLTNGHAHSTMHFQPAPTQYKTLGNSIAPSPPSSTAATSLFTSSLNGNGRWMDGSPRGNRLTR